MSSAKSPSMLDTWTCHVCGKERPDEKIAVYSRVRPIADSGATFSENIRYCIDDASCVEGAKQTSFLDEEGMLPPAQPAPPPYPSLLKRIKQAWFNG
jgi:hypothetical protein